MGVWLDDEFPEHPKVEALDDDLARWLYVAGLCYANRNLTGGRIPKGAALRLTDKASPKLIGRLLAVLVPGKGPLWEDRGDHYVIHDYEQHQQSAEKRRAEVEEGKRKRSEHARRAALARHHPPTEQESGSNRASPEHPPGTTGAEAGAMPNEPGALAGASAPHAADPTPYAIEPKPTATPLSADAEAPPPSAEVVPITNGHPPWLDLLGPRLADLDTTGTWDLLTPYVESWDLIHDTVDPPHVMGNLIALTCDFVTRVTGEPPPDGDRSRIAMLVRSHGKAALLGYSKALGATQDETPEARFKYARGVITRFIRELEATG